MNARANQLARRLRALGVRTDTPVALAVERSLDMIVGILGILKAGGAYVPLDPAYPPERLAWMLEDALRDVAAPVLVTQAPLVERFLPASAGGEATVPRLVFLDDRAALAAESAEDLPELPDAGPESLAYVIYTSGSTGRPKGVLVSHGSAGRLFTATERWFGFGPDDVWTLFHSYAFDFSVWEIWGALLYGGELVIVPREVSRSPQAFYELLATERVTVLSQTPLAFRQLVHLEGEEGERPLRLRWVIFGGEALEPAMLAPWIARHGADRPALVNMYGITETTVHVSFRPLRAEDAARPGGSPLGEPIPDLQIHLLGRHGELLPVGVPGEIHVGGAGLARGYLGLPALTAERFVPAPFSPRPGDRLYRSGDLARRRPDGDLDYLGRIDSQVKVRGFRIELGEIEAALGRHPGVRESAVMVRDAAVDDRRLVAWVVLRGAPVAPEELREHLRRILPEHMVPADFVSLERLPLTAHGKLDRRALPEPAAAAGAPRAGTAPRDPIESQLAAIWRQVLRIDEVTVEDNFFELGGHSLLVMQLASRVRAVFGVDLPVRAIFEASTLAALAARLAALLPEEAPACEAPAPIPRLPRGGGYPLSFAQERLWFLAQLDPGESSYNIWVALRMEGRLDGAALAAALAEVVRRHDVLRTRFVVSGERPVQVVGAPPALLLPLVDLAALPEPVRRAASGRLGRAWATRPFDMAQGPLLRLALVRLAGELHQLLFVMHHAITDGWSMGVFAQEVAALYAARVSGRARTAEELARELPELPVQYGDYAAWQREWLAGETLERQLSHWRTHLAGAPEVLELPTDRPRPPLPSHRGGVESLRISAAGLASLEGLGRRLDATPFMVLLAAFGVLLWRSSGQRDLVVGTPIANRGRVELEPLIGFFVNTIPLRLELDGAPSFAALAQRVRQAAIDGYAHKDLPFEMVVEALRPERDLSRSPLFQAFFILQNLPAAPFELPELTLAATDVDTGRVAFDLTLSIVPQGSGYLARLEFARDLFDATTARRLLDRFDHLLAGSAAAADAPLADLPLLAAAERQQLLREWNGAAAGEEAAGLHDLFAAAAARRPDAVAIVRGDEALTFRELGRRADRIAHRLRRSGVGPEVRVAICCERSLDMAAAVLAVLASGGAYVPLDPELPAARLAAMLEDSGAAVLLTQASLGRRGESFQGETILLDREALREPPAGAARAGAGGDHLAYLVYTSGSTGRPKGVLGTHGAAISYLRFLHEAFALAAGDRVLQVASLSFDASVRDLLGPLLAGATVVLLDDGRAKDPAAWLAEIDRQRITCLLSVVPSLLRILLEEAEARGGAAASALRLVLASGERLYRADGERARQVFGAAVEVVNQYGPTECTMTSSYHRTATGAASAGEAPIGRPIPHRRFYVVQDGSAAPLGAVGELHIGGGGLSRGYLGQPDRTAAAFLPDPYGTDPGGRLYATGDRARYLADGTLEFLGRLDRQVKIRGIRVEPGEVETTLAGHPGLREVAVAAADGLVAFVVPPAGEPWQASALRDWLRERLPDYLVPARFVELAALPRTANGKVDRQRLAHLAADGASASETPGRQGTPPQGEVEEMVAAVWRDMLGRQWIGREESFFDLGGHSLLAARALARLRRVLAIELPLRDLFEEPTTAGLAERIEGRLRAGRGPAPPPLVAVDRPRDRFPLSFAQQRLWFLDRLQPGGSAYNMPQAVRVRGPLAPPALRRALQSVVDRHEVLRASFPLDGELPVQSVAADLLLMLPEIDLRSLAPAVREKVALRLVAEEARRPFRLDTGPLLRVGLLRLHAAEHVLLVTLHHAVADGWSVALFTAELAALYGEATGGSAARLPELPIQYADFALWQRRLFSTEVLASEMAYWRGQLAGAADRLELPADRPRPAVWSGRGARLPFAFAGGLVDPLRDLGRRHGTTLFMTLLAAFQALLARLTGGTDISVGTPVSGRRHVETEALIGLFVNLLVLRTDLAGDPDVALLLGRVRAVTLAAFTHQDLPFEKVVEELQPERHTDRSPLFQVQLALQNVPAADLALPGLAATPIALAERPAKVDLNLIVWEEGRGLRGMAEYGRDLFDGATIARLVGQLGVLLAAAGAAAATPLSALPLLTAGERQQLREWNDTAGTAAGRLPAGATRLQQPFELQAARRPCAVAVVGQGVALTYGELEARANRLARHLRRLGVGPEVRVGLGVERSPEMVVALLGILKAGGAYVPLDPAHPRERLAAALADGRIAVLLTEERWRERFAVGDGEAGPRVVCLDRRAARIAAEEASPIACAALPESLAYVIFTSGSTGRPKGVELSHRAVVNFLRAMAESPGLGDGDVVPALTTLTFDIAGLEIYLPLAVGGRVEVVGREEGADGRRLAARMVEAGVTVMQATPATWHLLLGSGWEGQRGLKALCGGEALSQPLAAALAGRGVELWNLYGPTETAVWSAVRRVPPVEDLAANAAVGLGGPILNTRIHVVDRQLVPLAVGVAGELLIGGAGLARGYSGRPDLTAERFVPDPWDARGGRLYRTGDMARRRADGGLEFLGRLDHQVKVRGFRIELGEIEAALLRHPQVGQAVVMARGADAERRLVAYLVARDGTAPASADLRASLLQALPEYMVPSAFVTLDAMPLNASGKVDRRALPETGPEVGREGAKSYRAPRTPLEELLAEMWADLLGRARVGVDDSFFELGGHSLLATQVVGRVRSALGVELSLRQLFAAPTVAGVAAAVGAAAQSPAGASAPPIRPVPRTARLPLSYAQERLWLVDQLARNELPYDIPVALRLCGAVRPEVLSATLAEIVRRHETLRTRFVSVGGRPLQEIAAEWRPELPVIDLRGLAPAVAAPQLQALVTGEQGSPFDLETGRLLRASLLRVGDEDAVLLFTMHHIISDGWSMGLLLRELAAIYPALSRGEASPLPDLPLQYVDFAVWQRGWLQGGVLDEQLGYWTRELAGLTALDLPTDREPRPGRTSPAGSHPLAVPAELHERVRVLARRQGATPFMVLLTVFQTLLHRLSGQDDVAVGTPIANRNRAEIELLIGFFVNQLVLRGRFGAGLSFSGQLARVLQTTLAAYDHQDLPFALIVEALRPDRRQGAMPLADAMFVLQNHALPQIELPGLELAPLSRSEGADLRAQSLLVMTLVESRGQLHGMLGYDSGLIDRETAARWRGHWLSLLAAAVAAPERRIDELPLLAESERHQVLVEWGADGEVVLQGDLPAALGVWGELCRRGPDGALERTGRRARRRAGGRLELAGAAPSPSDRADETALASAERPPAATELSDSLARRQAELAKRFDGLSPAQRERLAKRLAAIEAR